MLRHILLMLLLLIASSPARAATYYVRPLAAEGFGTGAGTSYDDAFNGFKQIVWGEEGVGPGDTLYICGTHIYGEHYGPYENVIKASGEEGALITLRGDFPTDPGILIGSRRIGPEAFTNHGDGTYSVPWTWSTGRVWLGDVEDGAPRLHRAVSSVDECRTTEGSVHWTKSENVLWVNPRGDIDSVYANWTPALNLDANDYLQLESLRLFGASFNRGIITLAHNTTTGANYVTINNCELAFAEYTGIYANRASNHITISNTKIHDVPTGTYTIAYGGQQYSFWTFRGIEAWSGADLDNILPATKSDRHCIGGQNISDVLVEDCYIHDWAGDGIGFYITDPPFNQNNVTIRRNRLVNLNDNENRNYHFGVFRHGDSLGDFSERSKNWRIYQNIIINLGGDRGAGNGVGAAIRLKGGPAADGDVPLIFNNVFQDCHYGIYWMAVSSNPALGLIAKNNISLSPRSGGYHVYVGRHTGGPLIDLNHNLYFPDTQTGDNQFAWNGRTMSGFADWRNASGQDAASPLPSDPLFVNTSGTFGIPADFKLSVNSPAIDAGARVGGIPTDFFGAALRDDDPPDIGVHEYRGAAVQPTPIPTPTPSPSPTPTPGPLDPGSFVQFNETVRIRSAAGLQHPAVGLVTQGTVATVQAGPVSVNGLEWLNLRFAPGGEEGWIYSNVLTTAPSSTVVMDEAILTDLTQSPVPVASADPIPVHALGRSVQIIADLAPSATPAPLADNPPTVPSGTMGTIEAGPQLIGGVDCWEILFENGIRGWCSAAYLAEVSGGEKPASASALNPRQRPPIQLDYADTTSAPIGAWITLWGISFGDRPGQITIGSTTATEYFQWTDKRIDFRIPPGTVSGNLVVRNLSGASSNPLPFVVRSGRILHVRSGATGGVGSLEDPLSSLAQALQQARAGDTVYILQGVYRETLQPAFGGTAARPIMFKALPGHRPLLDGRGLPGTPDGIRLEGTSAHDLIFSGLTLRNFDQSVHVLLGAHDCGFFDLDVGYGEGGFFFYGASGAFIAQSTFHHNREFGVIFNNYSSNIKISDCESHHNAATNGGGFEADATCTDITLFRCSSFDNIGDGFDLRVDNLEISECTATRNATGVRLWRDARVQNTSLFMNRDSGIHCDSISGQPGRHEIINCTVAGSRGPAGIEVANAASVSIVNTISAGGAGPAIAYAEPPSSDTLTHSILHTAGDLVTPTIALGADPAARELYYSEDIALGIYAITTGYQAPLIAGTPPVELFQAYAVGNLQPAAESPAIGFGLDNDMPDYDIERALRGTDNDGFEVGAYEQKMAANAAISPSSWSLYE